MQHETISHRQARVQAIVECRADALFFGPLSIGVTVSRRHALPSMLLEVAGLASVLVVVAQLQHTTWPCSFGTRHT